MASWLSRIDNLIPNPSAEVNTTGWQGNNVTLTRSTAWKWAGLASFSMVSTTAALPSVAMLTPVTVADANRVIISAGSAAKARATMMTQVAGRQGRIAIEWRNAASGMISSDYGPWVALPVGVDTLITYEAATLIAPAGTVFATVRIEYGAVSGTVAVGNTCFVDGVMLSPTEGVVTYVDGSFGTYHHWTGTAHQSPSYRDPLPVLQTAKRYGQTVISSELWLANIDNTLYEDISTNALEGKVSTNVHNAIKSALSLTVKDPERIRPYTDVVAPIINVTGSDGITYRHQLGLFICTPAKHTHRESLTTGNLEARDLTWILANDYFGTTYSVAAGEDAIAKIITILASCGLTRYSLPNAGTLFTVARTWPADKSKLEIVNDILNGIGYYTLWADRQGILTSRPYFELASAEPALKLFSGEGGHVIDAIEQEGVYEGVANKVIVYKENTQGNPIIVRRTNTSLLSPVSTVNLGRTITKVIKDTNIANVTVARAMASAALETSASFTNKLKVTTMPLPDRDVHEVYDLAIYNKQGKPVGFGLWWCDGTEMGFTLKTAKQTHMLKRLEPYDGPEEVVS